MQLKRLRSPTICHLQATDPRKQCLSSKAWESDCWWCRCQSECEGQRTKNAEDRRKSMSRLKQSGREIPTFLCLSVVLLRPSTDWITLTHTGKDQLLYSAHKFKCSSLPETPSCVHPKTMFHQIAGYPEVHSSWHIKLTITVFFRPFHLRGRYSTIFFSYKI